MSNIHFISLASLPAEKVHSTLEAAVGATIHAMDDAQLMSLMKSPMAALAAEAQPIARAA